jgi:hypothetical protein
MTELELLVEYKNAREEVERLDEIVKSAKDKLEKATLKLVDDLQTRQASRTAKYDGIGSVTLKAPIINARSTDEDKLFDFLKNVGRDDLIKPTVHFKTLSAFVKEQIGAGDAGIKIPDFIEVWFKPSVQLNK